MSRTTIRLATILVFVVSMAVLGGVTPRARAASSTYVDQKHGFSIRLLSGWSQTPTQPGRSLEVAKFKDDRQGDFATLSIYRFQVAGSAVTTPEPGKDGESGEGEGEGEDEGKGEDETEEEEPFNPWAAAMPDSALETLTSFHERTVRGLEGRAKQRNIELDLPAFPDPKKVKFKKAKVEGEIYIIEFPAEPKLWWQGSYSVNGVVSNGSEEWCKQPRNGLI